MTVTHFQLLSICVGRVAPLFVRDAGERTSSVMSAIRKSPVSTLDNPQGVAVSMMGINGDESADLSVHAGREKAVYLMPAEHYSFWEEQRARARLPELDLIHGFLGENLTVSGILEDNIWIGDELQIGDVRLRVTQPREPCFKFNARMGYAHAAKHMVQQGNCGWYASVVTTGEICAGQTAHVIAGPRRISVAQQFAQLNYRTRQSLF